MTAVETAARPGPDSSKTPSETPSATASATPPPSGETGFVVAKRIGLGLGYFSLALGLAEVAAPDRLARWLGLAGKRGASGTLRAFGLRELAAGGMLLRGPAVSANVWNRVIGDVMDAAALGIAARASNRKGALALAGGVVAGALVADVLTARALDRRTGRTWPAPGASQRAAA